MSELSSTPLLRAVATGEEIAVRGNNGRQGFAALQTMRMRRVR
jgi:hypothetical protein